MDATNENISEKLPDGQYNQNFKRDILVLYLIWMFIRQDGILEQREEWPPVARWFNRVGSEGIA